MKKLVFLLAVLLVSTIFAQADPGSAENKSPFQPADDFIAALSLRFNSDPDELTKLSYRGYGRIELIKLLLISKESKTDLKNLVKKRDKHWKLADIAKERGIIFETIFMESEKIKDEIDFAIASSTTAQTTPDVNK